MTVITIILAAVSAVMLILLAVFRMEIRHIREQLTILENKDTNTLIASTYGTCDELITDINALLKQMRDTKTEYIREKHVIEQMLTNISHDLRTPLTSAMGYVELVRRKDISEEERQRELEVIHKRMLRLEELINSFFEFSKMISGSENPEIQTVDLIAVLEECIVHYFDDFCNVGREISFDCKGRLKIQSNKAMLMRIFDNLISNSLKHGEGTLAIKVDDPEGLKISFDNPTSDEDIDADRVFDEFYTTDISRTKGSSGLGLAIAKQFTVMLGGKISADTRDGHFVVTVSLS